MLKVAKARIQDVLWTTGVRRIIDYACEFAMNSELYGGASLAHYLLSANN